MTDHSLRDVSVNQTIKTNYITKYVASVQIKGYTHTQPALLMGDLVEKKTI